MKVLKTINKWILHQCNYCLVQNMQDMETAANTCLYVYAHARERAHTHIHTINSTFIHNFKNPNDKYNFMHLKQ